MREPCVVAGADPRETRMGGGREALPRFLLSAESLLLLRSPTQATGGEAEACLPRPAEEAHPLPHGR